MNIQQPTPLSKEELLDFVPQKEPFRFIDKILEVDENHIVGSYQFRTTEFFYPGHFPDSPITPGVILVECMGQFGLVAFSIYLLSLEIDVSTMQSYRAVLAEGSFELYHPVWPGDQVTVRVEKLFWRQKKLKSKIEMFRQEDLVASAVLAGVAKRK